jgi:hypothetical protein
LNNELQRGQALVTVLMLMALVSALLAAYFGMTAVELSTTRSSINSVKGFYTAEAGLNIRAQAIRQVFDDYGLPSGSGPSTGGSPGPCESSNMGSGDFACLQHALSERMVTTYVLEEPGNPVSIVIPRGEPYQNLKAEEYRYVVNSVAVSGDGSTEALLEMRIKSRLVALFQFIAFYGKDLEIQPGPVMNLSGPLHTNGDLYLSPSNQLDISGQITSAGDIYRGQKSANVCQSSLLRVLDPDNLSALPSCIAGRMQYTDTDLAPWNGMILASMNAVSVPPPKALDPTPGELYWDRADLRVMLNLNGTPAVEVRNQDGSLDGATSTILGGCAAASHTTNAFFNNREGSFIEMLDVDMEALLDCMHGTTLLGGAKDLDDGTDGGLVLYLGVDGPNSNGVNNYGVRVYNGAELASTLVAAPDVRGLSVVSNQAAYVLGDYNLVNKKPAAFLCDSLNVLSNGWLDGNSTAPLSSRVALNTTINAAFLAGTDSTGGIEGAGGQDGGGHNGGLENYPRFHEDWGGHTLTYRGSFVSLNVPQHVSGAWGYGDPYYQAPNRDWDYDTDFDDVTKLPPLSPRFTYNRQDLLLRRYEL